MSLLSGPASLLGIGGNQGEHFKAGQLDNKGTKSLAEMLAAARGDKVNTAGQGLVGGGSLADALKGMTGDEMSGLASSPVFGNVVAQHQVQDDPLLSGLFGKGGSRENALNEEARLSSQGFKLQPEDVEAYGQASGNIARQFGQQEQSLASALAGRGMGAGKSGAVGAQFTGLQGNKNEQLGQMQMQIANDRMNNTMNRLTQTRNFINQLNTTGMNAEAGAFGRNLAGSNSRESLAESLASNERGDFDVQNNQNQAEMTSKLANKKQNLGDALSSGLFQGVEAGSGAALAGVLGGKSGKKTAASPTMAGDPGSVMGAGTMMA